MLSCDWETTWDQYQRSYKKRRIHGGRAFPAFMDYLRRFPAARTAPEKMIVIDRLVHAVHESADMVYTVPAAVNLIEGKLSDIISFLNELADGPESTNGSTSIRSEYQQKMEEGREATEAFMAKLEARRENREDRA